MQTAIKAAKHMQKPESNFIHLRHQEPTNRPTTAKLKHTTPSSNDVRAGQTKHGHHCGADPCQPGHFRPPKQRSLQHEQQQE